MSTDRDRGGTIRKPRSGNPNPHQARAAKKRRRIRKIGDLTDARRKLWQAVTVAEDVLLDARTDDATALRAVHALTQAVQAHAKLIEVGELEARVAELEEVFKQHDQSRMRRAV